MEKTCPKSPSEMIFHLWDTFGMDPSKIAEAVGVTTDSIYKWFRNDVKPTLKNQLKLHQVFQEATSQRNGKSG